MGTELLTEREMQVAGYIAKGWSNKQIGSSLHISESTVKNHIHNIFNKLRVHSRTGIAVWLVESKMIGSHAKPLIA